MKKIKDLRFKINELDVELLELLAKRFGIVREIGEIKRREGVEILDNKRWQEVLDLVLSKAQERNLPKEFIEKFYALIHEESLKIEQEE